MNNNGKILAQEEISTRQEPSLWEWNRKSKRYHNNRTGRFIGHAEMSQRRDEFLANEQKAARRLTEQLFAREITINDFESGTREIVRRTYSIEYMLTRGGRKQMTQRDWGIIGRQLRGQYEYLQGFVSDLRNGRYTIDQIGVVVNRADMYLDSASQAFERGKTESYGMPALSAYPGDGSSECLSRDKCEWIIVETPIDWQCTWKLNPAEHCSTCLQRSVIWNPLIIAKA